MKREVITSMHSQLQLGDRTAQHAIEGGHPRVEAMARAMIDSYQNCDAAALMRAGFSREDIDQHHEAAANRAHLLFMRDDTPATYDRTARIRQASEVITSLCPAQETITAHLRALGFGAAEIEDVLDEALARAGNSFAGMGGGR